MVSVQGTTWHVWSHPEVSSSSSSQNGFSRSSRIYTSRNPLVLSGVSTTRHTAVPIRAANQRQDLGLQLKLDTEEERAAQREAAEVAAAALEADAHERLKLEQQAILASKSPNQEIIDAEAQLFVRTYARFPVVFVRGEGCKLFDAEGKEYLDLTAGIAVNALGHGDANWVKAVTDQAATLAHVSNLYHSVPQVKLAKRLVESSFADRVFFSNSGTEANEAAIKFARKYQRVQAKEKREKSWLKLGEKHPATELVAFTNSFHGRTMGSLALTSKEQYRTPFEPIMPGVQFTEFGNLQAAEKIIRPGRTAAVFVEPVQGEGGVFPAVVAFLRGLRTLCNEKGALLVFDEVQCGLGRTGRMWAHEAYGVEPDIMTLAKPLAGGLPIGAVLVTEAVSSAIAPGDHGSTFAGGPLVCNAALAVLDRLQEPGFLQNVAAKGHFLRNLLREKLGVNAHFNEVRGSGLLVGVELDVSATPLVKAALNAGLLILTAGKGNVVRLAPPLTISEQEIRQAVQILEKCIPALDQTS